MVKHLTLIFLSLSLFSCSVRKVSVSKSQSEIKVDSVVTEVKDSSSVEQKGISIKEDIDEIELVPIDATKPIVIGGKEYFNATVRIKKTKREIIDTTKTIVTSMLQKNTVLNKQQKQELFIKSVDKKPSYFNLWWLLLIPLVALGIKRYILK